MNGPQRVSERPLSFVDWEATDDFHPDDTDTQRDFEKNMFLDLRKPLLRQMWEGNFRCVLFQC